MAQKVYVVEDKMKRETEIDILETNLTTDVSYPGKANSGCKSLLLALELLF
jgi:hypothetical protein